MRQRSRGVQRSALRLPLVIQERLLWQTRATRPPQANSGVPCTDSFTVALLSWSFQPHEGAPNPTRAASQSSVSAEAYRTAPSLDSPRASRAVLASSSRTPVKTTTSPSTELGGSADNSGPTTGLSAFLTRGFAAGLLAPAAAEEEEPPP
jgi:hypothetical protein